MAATYMLRKHLRSLEISRRPENQARRAIEIEAAKRGAADRAKKFPSITEDNFDAANTYQNERIAYWQRELN
jgi:hypothetical protein